jgi:hypothetical protein
MDEKSILKFGMRLPRRGPLASLGFAKRRAPRGELIEAGSAEWKLGSNYLSLRTIMVEEHLVEGKKKPIPSGE